MDGRGEEYKYVVLFDLATVDILTAPDPEWGLRTNLAADIRSAA